jgi:copper chaperone CopZ
MKKYFVICCLLVLQNVGQAQFTSASMQASGLTCSMCSNAINKALQALPFVAKVESNIGNASFVITFKDSMDVEPDQIKAAVEDAGFFVANLKLTLNFQHINIENDTHVTLNGRTFHFLNVKAQQLNGTQSIQLVDKDFVTVKQFKKYLLMTKMDCIKTGKIASCCKREAEAKNDRIYHVTI